MKKLMTQVLFGLLAIASIFLVACKENKPKQEPTKVPEEIIYLTLKGDVPIPPLTAFGITTLEDLTQYCKKNNLVGPTFFQENKAKNSFMYHVQTGNKKIPFWYYSFVKKDGKQILLESNIIAVPAENEYFDENGETEHLNKMVEGSGFKILQKLDLNGFRNMWAWNEEKKVCLVAGPFMFKPIEELTGDPFPFRFNFSYSETTPVIDDPII